MRNFGKRTDGLGGRRRNEREPVVLAASAIAPGTSRSVVGTDVSPIGAKLQARELPKIGTAVLVSVGEVELFAKVVWSRFDECGITFDEPLAGHIMAHLKVQGRWAKVMGLEAA